MKRQLTALALAAGLAYGAMFAPVSANAYQGPCSKADRESGHVTAVPINDVKLPLLCVPKGQIPNGYVRHR
jgi:hypothetical protein